ncbi:MAG: HAD family hydrolase [Planctomycetes bacterium]|nr:HAD family hydrolase [Planctomycetota bacterium]
MTETDSAQPLKELTPNHKFFVAIDSDGCVFNSMELKHKECFIPNTIKHWHLQPISKYARRAAEFVNLYSRWRGINRFPALIKVFDLLQQWDQVQQTNTPIPPAGSLRGWIARESKLANPTLQSELQRTGDPILQQTLQWSQAVNAAITEMVHHLPPFQHVLQSLEKISTHADIIVCSATPGQALRREWRQHKIAPFVKAIAGQEMGAKSQHLADATGQCYQKHHILMIGDAPGDLNAARDNHALFYPIIPGSEVRCWKKLHEEIFDIFIRGQYAGDCEQQLITEFKKHLPQTPSWDK